MLWFPLRKDSRPERRIVASSQILQDDDEIVIQHGYHKYRLRATRSGRLTMSGNRLAIQVRWIAVGIILLVGYLASLPVVAAIADKYAPTKIEPLLQVAYFPGIVIYETCPWYEAYVEWAIDLLDHRL